MKQSQVARRRLDEVLSTTPVKSLSRPHRGWIRAIRESLVMSTTDLGQRMGATQQAVVELEKGEIRQTIQLDTLQRAAAAMNCEVVYAIVPRTSLEDIVNQRAREKARTLLSTVSHHSRLEDQAVSDAELEEQVEEVAADLINKRGLWRDPK